ncbi:unnamed protein product [Aureobasidium pullulans]|nr:unnamed protein product [Aureobasidium pullulans]
MDSIPANPSFILKIQSVASSVFGALFSRRHLAPTRQLEGTRQTTTSSSSPSAPQFRRVKTLVNHQTHHYPSSSLEDNNLILPIMAQSLKETHTLNYNLLMSLSLLRPIAARRNHSESARQELSNNQTLHKSSLRLCSQDGYNAFTGSKSRLSPTRLVTLPPLDAYMFFIRGYLRPARYVDSLQIPNRPVYLEHSVFDAKLFEFFADIGICYEILGDIDKEVALLTQDYLSGRQLNRH